MKEMIEAVRRLHQEHQFAQQGGEDMFFRMNLLMEEVGEICQCLTKGKDAIAEEHADLLIVLLGNCFALGIDIESEFWRKIDKISRYGTRLTGNHCRLVSPSEHGSATGIK